MSKNKGDEKRKVEDSSSEKPPKKLFEIVFFLDWCKACGICIAFCPKKIILADKIGKPEILNPDSCIGCRFCEIHCPDFAITVKKRYPKRRESDVS